MIFIDTGAFLARWLEADQHHERALEAWDRLAQERMACATSSFVIDETLTLLGRRAGHPFAAERARSILGSRVLKVLRPLEKDEWEAVALFEKYADQGVSFTDCVSFALMRQAKIGKAFSFDRHFELAGFQLWP